MATRVLLSFGAGATLFGPLGKHVAEPMAEFWAKVTEALPFLAPAGVQLERQMARLNDRLDAALKAKASADAAAPAVTIVESRGGGRSRVGVLGMFVVVVGGTWAYGRYTGKWWAVVPSEMPATQALLDKSREKVERGVALLADKLELARVKVIEVSERVAAGIREQRAMRAQVRAAASDVGAAHQRVHEAHTVMGRVEQRLQDAQAARAYLIANVQLLCAFVSEHIRGAEAIAPQDPRRQELQMFAQGLKVGSPKPLEADKEAPAPPKIEASPEATPVEPAPAAVATSA